MHVMQEAKDNLDTNLLRPLERMSLSISFMISAQIIRLRRSEETYRTYSSKLTTDGSLNSR